jgi:hypothetical protein
MEALKSRLTEKEWNWIKAHFEAQGNATEATRTVYGVTPGRKQSRQREERWSVKLGTWLY